MATTARLAATSVRLGTDHQTLEHLQDLVGKMAGLAGCPRCGRIAYLDFKYLVDPEANLKEIGVQSIVHQHV